MKNRHILIVDDMPDNIEIIEGFLNLGENRDHGVLTCSNGQEGLTLLEKYKDSIDVILLDRMLPIMSGIDYLKKVKSDKKTSKIPVIMQTAASDKEDMLEGFRLGVYHYLVKPFSPIVFNSVVKSAINLYTKQREQYLELKSSRNLLNYIDRAVFKIKNLEDVDVISVSLARMYPNPNKVVLGISEILTNAIEHGNLDISYQEKTELNMKCQWKEEVNQRLKLLENRDKKVIISYIKKDNEIILNVKDEGKGFDFHPYLDFDPNRSMDNHGRGIAFANNLSFDKLEYLGKGNEVNCIVRL